MSGGESWRMAVAAALAVLAGLGSIPREALGQAPSGGTRRAAPAPHGTPKGWKFRWPPGDAARGREAFVKFACFTCHPVLGESFPAPVPGATIGPELSQHGPAHEPEYLAESVVNPNAEVARGQGYDNPDGSSKMTSFAAAMTVQEAIDVVAYLRSLRPSPGRGATPTAKPGPHRH